MSEQAITSIVTAVFGLLGTIFTGIMVYYMAKLKASNERAAVQAENVAVQAAKVAVEVQHVATKLESTATAADAKQNAVAKVVDGIHTLVNNAMGIQLKRVAMLSRRWADAAKADPSKSISEISSAESEADEDERLLKEHQGQQGLVDAKYPTGIPNSQDPPK